MKLSGKNTVTGATRTLALTMAAACIVGAFAGCATHEKVVVKETVVAQPVVRKMPTPIHEDRGTAPGPEWGWVAGHWKWEGNDWFWVHGRWVQQAVPPMPVVIVEQVPPPPSNHHYWVPGHWVWQFNGHGGWVWVKGSWHA
ncbi:hypothetical protein [Silvimonas iriomotensis]|uniref:YXWGXW repeat-containing protein n=1 Tax=Silvimonas iriomotensis TaxID=449662 RepID=A0ABQ2PE04_9NEIS|nr:hypothetical protein [Silvimonas iriomotensis]GGP23385.1 hypothetical protein GCM10010970_33850 [Silvimonas iriomotensis]